MERDRDDFFGYYTHIETIAGSGLKGFLNGNRFNSQFNNPYRLCVDREGNIIVSDFFQHLVRIVSAKDGMVSTLAGGGNQLEGGFQQVKFYNPGQICIDKDGKNLIVCDINHHRIVRMNFEKGAIETIAGNTYGYVNDSCLNSKFYCPFGVCLDDDQNIIVADTNNHVIRKINIENDTVETLAGTGDKGNEDGELLKATFHFPSHVCLDHDKNIIVTDNEGFCIRRIIVKENRVVTIAGKSDFGYVNGDLKNALFNYPSQTCIDAFGNILVSDKNNNCIRIIKEKEKVVETLTGDIHSGFIEGDLSIAKFKHPRGLCMDNEGNILVGDSENYRVRLIKLHKTSILERMLKYNESKNFQIRAIDGNCFVDKFVLEARNSNLLNDSKLNVDVHTLNHYIEYLYSDNIKSLRSLNNDQFNMLLNIAGKYEDKRLLAIAISYKDRGTTYLSENIPSNYEECLAKIKNFQMWDVCITVEDIFGNRKEFKLLKSMMGYHSYFFHGMFSFMNNNNNTYIHQTPLTLAGFKYILCSIYDVAIDYPSMMDALLIYSFIDYYQLPKPLELNVLNRMKKLFEQCGDRKSVV